MRTTPILGAILCLTVAAGCAQAPQQVGGAAGPAGAASSTPVPTATSAAPSPSTSTSPATKPSPSKSVTTSPPEPETPSVLGPKGFGALRLGLTAKQAQATGMITKFTGGLAEGCSGTAHLRADSDANVYYAKTLGVEIIDAYPGIRTPEGIKIGSSLAAVRAAYPDWENVEAGSEAEKYTDGRGYADVPGNSKATYRIATRNKKVEELTLQYDNQNCYE